MATAVKPPVSEEKPKGIIGKLKDAAEDKAAAAALVLADARAAADVLGEDKRVHEADLVERRL